MIIAKILWKVRAEQGTWPPSTLDQPINIPALMRRRLTNVGRQVGDNLYENREYLNHDNIPWVIASQHGDTTRMLSLLSDTAKNELLSPTEFSLSVHNAIGALFSIATGNKQLQTALSGSEATFESGLLEAYALQKEKGGFVGYIYYDVPLPSCYEMKNKPEEMCISLILGDINSSPSLSLQFVSTSHDTALMSNEVIAQLLGFINSSQDRIEIPVRGGTFILERCGRYD